MNPSLAVLWETTYFPTLQPVSRRCNVASPLLISRYFLAKCSDEHLLVQHFRPFELGHTMLLSLNRITSISSGFQIKKKVSNQRVFFQELPSCGTDYNLVVSLKASIMASLSKVKAQFLCVILNVIIFTSFSIHITHFIQLHHFNCQRLAWMTLEPGTGGNLVTKERNYVLVMRLDVSETINTGKYG